MKAWLAPYQWERQSAPGTDSRHRGAWGKRGEAQLGREPWKPHQVEAGPVFAHTRPEASEGGSGTQGHTAFAGILHKSKFASSSRNSVEMSGTSTLAWGLRLCWAHSSSLWLSRAQHHPRLL